MRGKADLQDAEFIVLSLKPELAIAGKLLTRTALAPFGCKEALIKHEEKEDRSDSKLVVPKLPVETTNDEQGPSGSGKKEERHEKEKKYRQPEETMEQEADKSERDDHKASVGGVSSRDLSFLDDDKEGIETLAGTTEPAEDEYSTLEPPADLMNITHNLPESSSSSNDKTTIKKI